MSETHQTYLGILIVIAWLAGIAIAKGFWMTLFAIIPPVGWYLAIERIMDVTGLI